MHYSTISVIGLGYIGLPTAALLAAHGHKVIGVDTNEHVVTTVNAGKVHIIEPELETVCSEIVKSGTLRATMRPEAADVFIIAVPTPFMEEHKPDVRHIEEAAHAIAPVLASGNLVILESTSPVGTTEQLASWLANARPDLTFPQSTGEEADIQIAYCPERVLPGRVMHELLHNDRIVGGLSGKSSQLAADIYKSFVTGDIAITDARTAELCKLTENSFRDVNIAFANEMSMICDKLDIDVGELIRLANRHPRVNILQPSTGVGGHCIPVDPWFIVDSAPEQARLIRTAREVNDYKTEWVLEKVKAKIDGVLAQHPRKRMADVTVLCLGLTYKPDVADLRNSPSIYIVRGIAMLGCNVMVVESHITELPEALRLDNVQKISLQEGLCTADIVSIHVNHHLFAKESIALNKKIPVLNMNVHSDVP